MVLETSISRVTHIVTYKFSPNAKLEEMQKIIEMSHAMVTACIHPFTKKPYILSVNGGPAVNERDKGKYTFTYRFSTQFDYDYFINNDPVHQFTATKMMQAVVAGWMTIVGNLQYMEDNEPEEEEEEEEEEEGD
ncbi:hypothetical protein EDC01DRAFT_780263 [Geopyxis carbonaria]|nr:hypothetical protein EDC01DRAFT_780263 [Geopyxis carbonaria]